MSKILQISFLLIALAVCSLAFAHAKLRSSTPADHSTLTDPPKSLTLVFNEEVQLAILKVTTGATEIPIRIDSKSKAASSVTVALPRLEPGNYQVTWSALSPSDGHIMKGRLGFSVLVPL